MSKPARIVLFFAVVAAAIAVAFFASKGNIKLGGDSVAKKDAKEDDRFKPAERGDINVIIKATGSVEPRTRVKVKSEASGKIEKLFIKEGDDLVPGSEIAVLDQTDQKINLRRAQLSERLRYIQLQQLKNGSNKKTLASLQANVDSARLAVESAEDYFKRIDELYKKEYATRQEYDDAKKRLEDARLALRQAEEQLSIHSEEVSPEDIKSAEISWQLAKVDLEDAQKSLGDATIKSPIKGTVLSKMVEVGDTVISSVGTFGEGTTICEVADLTFIQIRASVDEIDIGRIAIGQKANVTVDALPDEKFEGKIVNVFQQGTTQGGITSFTVIIEVDNSERKLLSAMTTNVEIIAQTVEDVIVVPYDSVRTDDELGYIVYVKGSDAKGRVKPEKRKVTIGATDYTSTEIKEGLKEGELVMVKDVPLSTRKDFGGGGVQVSAEESE
ncbi:MAG: efflux RND transporter periplasmic adaptor subunit [bacterium]|jgi:HlyD family secretion protein